MRFAAVAAGCAACLAPLVTAYHPAPPQPTGQTSTSAHRHACSTRACRLRAPASLRPDADGPLAGPAMPQLPSGSPSTAVSRRGLLGQAVSVAGVCMASCAAMAVADEEAAGSAGAAAVQPAAVEEGGAVVAAAGGEAVAAKAVAAGTTARDFTLPYNGKELPMTKLLGTKATLIINGKIDDPAAMQQMPDIVAIASKYGREGLHVIIVPTDQGYFEADEDRVVKIKFYQFFGFGQFPVAVVTDKTDIVGNTAHPLYKYMCRTLKNPNGIGRITLNYEKFLLDARGVPIRRYPRQLPLAAVEEDIVAALRGAPLPTPGRAYTSAWVKAKAEAERSEYAFKRNLNYYDNPVV